MRRIKEKLIETEVEITWWSAYKLSLAKTEKIKFKIELDFFEFFMSLSLFIWLCKLLGWI